MKNYVVNIINNYENLAGVWYGVMMEDLDTLIISNEGIVVWDLIPNYSFCNFMPSCSECQENELFYYHPDHLGSTGMITDNNANITKGYLYAPFGEIISEYGGLNNNIPKYAFNAKELDEENGMYYYSARYYAPPTFISRDPMFEKYPYMSPYTYCANNPMKYVDPTGMEVEGYINGPGADAATAQLNASTSLTITRDSKTGKLSSSGEIGTQQDQDLSNAINDPTITVNVYATYDDKVYTPGTGKEIPFDAGFFMGNSISKDGKNVRTRQAVNPFKMTALDCKYGNDGQMMLHEFMESYIGGKISLQTGESADPALRNSMGLLIGNGYRIYVPAHKNAPPQPGAGVCTPDDFEEYRNQIESSK